MREVLHRYNVVASTVLGIGSLCTVFFGANTDETSQAQLDAERAPNWKIREELRSDIVEANMTFVTDAINWRPGMMDPRLCACAMDDIRWPFAVFSHATRAVFIPYDGGADCFLPSSDDVPPARQMFRKWLSVYPHGR